MTASPCDRRVAPSSRLVNRSAPWALAAGGLLSLPVLAQSNPGASPPVAVTSAAPAGETRVAAVPTNYQFDPVLFRARGLSPALLERFNQADQSPPGVYLADVFVNQRFVERIHVDMVADAPGAPTRPCLSPEFLTRAGVLLAESLPSLAPGDLCPSLERLVPGASSQMDVGQLRLDLSVSQLQLRQVPRGYVAPNQLDTGESILFLNYLGNAYHVSYRDAGSGRRNAGYAAFSGGMNAGLWQFRHQSNLTYSSQTGTQWRSLRTYVQRPLVGWGSQLTLGQTFTSGQFFSGLNYTGVSLGTDERMLPDSQRGYAPVVRGVASSNARVTIRQNGVVLYQSTVPPGPFEIDDLYPTSYNGDLDVTVEEADGEVRRFSVPFAAVPQSLRAGSSRYQLALGRTRHAGDDAPFADATYQRGLSNAVTVNGGLRVSTRYQALMLGGVHGSSLGALGAGVTYSRADVPVSGYVTGWMAHLSYSRTFQPTSTTITLASYRYSTEGYRDLADVLGVRAFSPRGEAWRSSTYRQQHRFEAVLNQHLGRWGTVFVSASTQSYHDGRPRDRQLQLGYGKGFANGASLNLTVARQHTGGYITYAGWQAQQTDGLRQGGRDTVVSLSVSWPLGRDSGARRPMLSTSYAHHSRDGGSVQANVSGMANEAQTVNYNVGVSHQAGGGGAVVTGAINQRLPVVAVGATASRGSQYWQASVNAQGALAVHSGGVTFGPYLGETFALVQAPGAAGARVLNAQDTTIDRNGYALVPSLTPYRYNHIALDPQGMASDVELKEGEQRLAPVAGAAVRVRFQTRMGTALLIQARLPDDAMPPFGAEAFDAEGNPIGLVGQRGHVYVRAEQPQGQVVLRWGPGPAQGCRLAYDLTGRDLNQPLVRVDARCRPQ